MFGIVEGVGRQLGLQFIRRSIMDYDAWLFGSVPDDDWEAELEARRKLAEERRQELEDERNYYD